MTASSSSVIPRATAVSVPQREGARTRQVGWALELAYLLAVLAASALALSLVGRRPGWPVGQTPPDPTIVQLYAAHFRHGDFYPVWSSSDAFGLGTPLLLFYQRTFFTVGGFVFIVLGGHLKATMIATLAIFMVIGAYGMRKAIAVVSDSRLIQMTGSIGFLFTNWAFSEWFLRADQAEFAAYMIVPWLIYCCLALIKEERLSWWIVPTIVALFWAHNTVGLASVFLLTVTALVFLAQYGTSGLRLVGRRLVIATVLILAILGPGVIAEVKMGRYYDPASTIIGNNAYIHSFVFPHPWAYLVDTPFRWFGSSRTGAVPFGLNIQVDFAISGLLLLGLVASVIALYRRRKPGDFWSPPIDHYVLTVLCVSLVIYFFFQLSVSRPIWTSVWQLEVFGYAFRMMSFAIPLALVLAMIVADWFLRIYKSRWPRGSIWIPFGAATLWMASLILLSPITVSGPPTTQGAFPDAPFLPIGDLTPQPFATFRTSSAYRLFPEYLPVVQGQNSDRVYSLLHEREREAGSLSSVDCAVSQTSGQALESLKKTYSVVCRGSTELALPISFNPFTTVSERTVQGGLRHVQIIHVPTDPRIVVRVARAGSFTYVVRLPTLAGILL